MPAPDGGDDFVGIGDPLEGFGLSVVVVEEAVDGGLKIDDRTEDATLQPALGQCGEEALDGIESAWIWLFSSTDRTTAWAAGST